MRMNEDGVRNPRNARCGARGSDRWLWLTGLLLFAPGCAQVEIDGAPCPCTTGHSCCGGQCVKQGERCSANTPQLLPNTHPVADGGPYGGDGSWTGSDIGSYSEDDAVWWYGDARGWDDDVGSSGDAAIDDAGCWGSYDGVGSVDADPCVYTPAGGWACRARGDGISCSDRDTSVAKAAVDAKRQGEACTSGDSVGFYAESCSGGDQSCWTAAECIRGHYALVSHLSLGAEGTPVGVVWDLAHCQEATTTGVAGELCVGSWTCGRAVAEKPHCLRLASCSEGTLLLEELCHVRPDVHVTPLTPRWSDCAKAAAEGVPGDLCEGDWACQVPDTTPWSMTNPRHAFCASGILGFVRGPQYY